MAVNKKTIGVSSLLALLALATPAIQRYEGFSSDPYRDQIGKLTVCYGETEVRMRRYSKAECDKMLNGRAQEFGLAVAARNPELVGHPYQWAAATSLAYNIGIGAYNKSSVARKFSAGDWKGACSRFTDWTYAGGKFNKGLQNRRIDEKRLCLTQLPSSSIRLSLIYRLDSETSRTLRLSAGQGSVG